MSTRRTLQASPFLQSHYLITCVTCLLTCLNFDLSRFLLNCIQYYEIVTTLMGFLLVWMIFLQLHSRHGVAINTTVVLSLHSVRHQTTVFVTCC